MLYGIKISGNTPDERRTGLIAALDVLQKDLLTGPREATSAFFSQRGPLVLYVKPAADDAQSAPRIRPGTLVE